MDISETKTILLVEDEIITAVFESRQLEKEGYNVITASTGLEAVELIRNKSVHIDLILMDIDLGPGMDGTEAAEEILILKEIPIVFLSNHTEPEIVSRTEKITSYGYVVKNSSPTVLFASIKMAFRLFEAKNIYSQTFKNSINGLCIHQMIYADDDKKLCDCRFIRVNKAFETHTGFSSDELTGKTIREIFPKDDADKAIKLYSDIMKTGMPEQKQVFFRPAQKWFDLSIFPVTRLNFTVVVQNITEKRQAEENLKKSADNYKRLFEEHSAVKLIIDPETGRIHDANHAAAEFYGWTTDHLKKMKIQEINILSPEEIINLMSTVRKNKNSYFEFRHRDSRGDIKDVNVFTNKITVEGKDYLHSIVFDISEHLKTQRETLHALNSLIKNTPNLVIIFNSSGRYIHVSDSAGDLFNMAAEEVSGRNFHELLPAETAEDFMNTIKKLQCSHAPIIKRDKIKFNNEVRTFESTIFPILTKESPEDIFASIGTDITERLKKEDLLKNSILEKENMLKEFRHRTKNSFNMISSLIFLKSMNASSYETKGVLRELGLRVKSISEVYSLLNDTDSSDTIELDKYCEKIIDSMIQMTENYSIVRDIKPVITSSRFAVNIGMILVELLTNCIKYAFPDNSQGMIWVELKQAGDKISFSVRDNGVGICNEMNIDEYSSLGLSLVKTITEQMKGRFEIKSDMGTTVFIECML